MGGEDLMDRLLESYCPVIHGKKWYLASFHKFAKYFSCRNMEIPLSVGKHKLSHLEFQRHIALCLLKAEQANNRMSGSSAGLPAEAQFDGLNHLLGSTTQG